MAQTTEDLLAQHRLPVITTMLIEDGEGGYFIRAECPFLRPGRMQDYDWNDRLHIDGNHAEAALKLLADMGHAEDRRLIMGAYTDAACAFIQVPIE
jgi:hypothetical protein